MPDGATTFIAPNRDHAESFWASFTGDKATPIRLRFIYEGGDDRLPRNEQGEFLDPATRNVLPVDPKSGKHRKPKVWEVEGTLDQLWPRVTELQGHAYAAFYFPNRIKAGPGSGYDGMACDADVEAIRALHTDHDTGLPTEWHAEPSVIVHTSEGKGQALWRCTDLSVDQFRDAQRRLVAKYDCDKQVINPARVLRLPGSLHQKRAPSKVKYEDRDSWLGDRPAQQLLANLPPVPQRAERTDAPAADVEPISLDELRLLLMSINPATRRLDPDTGDGWFPIVRAVSETPIIGEDSHPSEIRAEKRRLLDLWLDGDLFHRALTADEKAHLSGEYRAPEYISHDYNSAPKDKRYGLGTLRHRARKEGGGPAASSLHNAEAFDKLRATTATIDAPHGYSTIQRPDGSYLPLGSDGKPRHPRDPNGHFIHSDELYRYRGVEWSTDDDEKHSRINRKTLLTIKQLRAEPDPVDLIEGLITERENVAFVGPPKSGKTYLALDAALSLAANLPALGIYPVTRKGYVVYLSGEGHAFMKRRVMAWAAERGLTEEQVDALPFFYNKGVPLAEGGIGEAQAFIAQIRAAAKARGFGDMLLCVIDTMARSLSSLDENSASTAAVYLNMTEELRVGLDCAVLTIAHATNKNAGKPREAKTDFDFRGSSGFSAGFDSTWITEMNSASGAVELYGKWFKDHDMEKRGFKRFFRMKTTALGVVLVPTEPPPEKPVNDTKAVTKLERDMKDWGIIGYRNALTTRELAEKHAGPEPVADPSLPDVDNVKRLSEWHATVDRGMKNLGEGSRARGDRRKVPLYAGLFTQGVPFAKAQEFLVRPNGLKLDVPGKRPTVMRLWYLPDPADISIPW